MSKGNCGAYGSIFGSIGLFFSKWNWISTLFKYTVGLFWYVVGFIYCLISGWPIHNCIWQLRFFTQQGSLIRKPVGKKETYLQKYSRLRCLLHVKVLMICFYLGWSGSTLLITKNIIKVGSKSLLLTCSSNKLWAYLYYIFLIRRES